MNRVNLDFANASCAHCARLVSQSLKKLDGVFDVDVDRSRGRLAVEFDPTRTSIDLICSLMEQIGYPTRPFSEKIVLFPPRSPANAA